MNITLSILRHGISAKRFWKLVTELFDACLPKFRLVNHPLVTTKRQRFAALAEEPCRVGCDLPCRRWQRWERGPPRFHRFTIVILIKRNVPVIRATAHGSLRNLRER